MTLFRLALAGAPNCGKTTLFNGLTGGRAKVANYPGATVETRIGRFSTPTNREIELIDLPGFYGLSPRSLDERVALDVLQGDSDGAVPDLVLVLIDAANLRTHLHSVLQLRDLGLPMILVLNMIDLARRDGLELDVAKLEAEVGLPVVTCQATRSRGREDLLALIDETLALDTLPVPAPNSDPGLKSLQAESRRLVREVTLSEPALSQSTRMIDKVLLHPVAGFVILLTILFLIFQAVFSWAGPLMDIIESGIGALGDGVAAALPNGWFEDLLVQGIIAGVGSVIVFLPQILILFVFILLLEGSGYMARAAFMMDELMSKIGLNGRAFIPLMSSFACAIPGIMAARVIENERDRLTTILIAPLMTCSARLPVYTVLIAAFVPPDRIGIFGLQGLVMFGLYIAAIVSGVIVAFILKNTLHKGPPAALMMELPTYKWPDPMDILIGLWARASAFLKRAGTIIMGTSIALWFLASYPAGASLRDSFAGRLGSLLEPVLKPIGFNLEMTIALIPGMAAREVAVGTLGTVYAVQNAEENTAGLASVLQNAWTLPMALSFLAWYVFAPQCFATLATIRRETNSWKWTGFAFAYLMGLAWIASFITFRMATAMAG